MFLKPFLKPKLLLAGLSLFVFGALVGNMPAQNAGLSPHVPDKYVLGEDEVKQLLLLLDTDRNGKVSKQEFMNFMQAEFDRLDVNKNGELDPRELSRSRVRPQPFSAEGK